MRGPGFTTRGHRLASLYRETEHGRQSLTIR